MIILKHVWEECACDEVGCDICDLDLRTCAVCGASEGELLSYCPGFRLNRDAREACFSGVVTDLDWHRRRRAAERYGRGEPR